MPTGHGVTRKGVLVRSDCAGYLTAEGREAMCAYGVTTVIDLRSGSELRGAQDDRFPRDATVGLHADGVAYLHIPLIDDGDVLKIGETSNMLDRYFALLAERGQAFRDVFTSMAQAEGGLLFHCFAGKDRTGIIAAMVLSLAGVPDEHVAADFAETDRQLANQYELWIAAAVPAARDSLRSELQCPPARILAVLEHLEDGWGGVAGYLESTGMTAETIDRLATKLI